MIEMTIQEIADKASKLKETRQVLHDLLYDQCPSHIRLDSEGASFDMMAPADGPWVIQCIDGYGGWEETLPFNQAEDWLWSILSSNRYSVYIEPREEARSGYPALYQASLEEEEKWRAYVSRIRREEAE